LLNENAGIIDDLILYRVDEGEFLLVVNASKIDEDLAWLEKNRPGEIQLTNRSTDFGAVAIQGLRALEFFRAWMGKNIEAPARNRIVEFPMFERTISIARTGYTGEDGFEVFFPNAVASQVWRSALETGAPFGMKPCGLGARDTLRLEMCYPLNGSDLSSDRNPLEAGLGFFVDLEKPDFIGREKLVETKRKGARERLVAFKMNGKTPPPRPHYFVFNNGERVGEITSGTLSPSLNIGVGMAYVSAASAKVGTALEVEIRGQKFPATIEKKPLYKKPS
jgi:aminomethyltransferase